MQKKNSKNP